jgi:histidyl-tRNA synthetase
MPNVSGVGISFGADRIYDVLTELQKFPTDLGRAAQVLFVNFGEAEQRHCIRCAAMLRRAGIATLIYPDAAKTKKQMEFANRNQIPLVAFVGEEEIASDAVTMKNMTTGLQEKIPVSQLVDYVLNA